MRYCLFLMVGLLAVATASAQDCTTADHLVYAGSLYFSPSQLTVQSGEVIGFYNEGGFHDVNGVVSVITGESFGNPGTFSLPAVTGGSNVCMGTITLTIPGTYNYDCSIGNHAAGGMVGSIIVEASSTSGCTEPAACNYNPDATEEDGSCDYTCCPGPGCCDNGTTWDTDIMKCTIPNPADVDLDACVGVSDILIVLSQFGECTP